MFHFFKFLYKPTYISPKKFEWRDILILLSLFLLCMILARVAIYINFMDILRRHDLFKVIPANRGVCRPVLDYAPILFIFSFYVFRDCVEELALRLSLVFKPIFLSISFLSLLLLYRHYFYYHFNSAVKGYLVILLLSAIVYFLSKRFETRLRNFWSNHFGIVFYFSAFLFSAIHYLGTFEVNSSFWFFPLAFLPQLIGGIFLGYTRMRYGIVYSMAFHILYNGTLTVMHSSAHDFFSILKLLIKG